MYNLRSQSDWPINRRWAAINRPLLPGWIYLSIYIICRLWIYRAHHVMWSLFLTSKVSKQGYARLEQDQAEISQNRPIRDSCLYNHNLRYVIASAAHLPEVAAN